MTAANDDILEQVASDVRAGMPEEVELDILNRAAQYRPLARFMGGATSLADALDGTHGALAQQTAQALTQFVTFAFPDRYATESELHDALNSFVEVLDATYPLEGTGSPADLVDPDMSTRSYLLDHELGREPGDILGDEKSHAANVTAATEFARLTGQTVQDVLAPEAPPEPSICAPWVNTTAGDKANAGWQQSDADQCFGGG